MNANVLDYLKYCLVLFDECTLTGLGTFRLAQGMPVKDNNNNLLRVTEFVLQFEPHQRSHPRLPLLYSSKQNCSEQEAETAIASFVKRLKYQLLLKKEAWLQDLGMLKEAADGKLEFVSQKFENRNFHLSQPINNFIPDASQQPHPESVSADSAGVVAEFGKVAIPTSEIDASNTSGLQSMQCKVIVPLRSTVDLAIPTTGAKSGTQTQSGITVFEKAKKPSETINVKKVIAIGGGICLLAFFGFRYLTPNNNNPALSAAGLKSNLKVAPTITPDAADSQIASGEALHAEDDNRSEKPLTTVHREIAPEIDLSGTEDAVLQDDEKVVADSQQNADFRLQTFTASSLKSATDEAKLPVGSAKKENAATQNAADIKSTSTTEHYTVTAPDFPGGAQKLNRYIQKKLHYPRKVANASVPEHVEGSMIVSFLIGKDGNAHSPRFEQSLGPEFETEVKRMIDNMPRWTPASFRGEAIEYSTKLKISFRVEN